MRSVADSFREDDRRRLRALSAEARVALALALGRRDLETFRQAHDPPLPRDEALRRLERQRQAGRRPSACVAALIG